MEELWSLGLLIAWMWREREHARERQALWEQLAGVTIRERKAWDRTPGPRRSYGDAAEWEIEQERLAES